MEMGTHPGRNGAVDPLADPLVQTVAWEIHRQGSACQQQIDRIEKLETLVG